MNLIEGFNHLSTQAFTLLTQNQHSSFPLLDSKSSPEQITLKVEEIKTIIVNITQTLFPKVKINENFLDHHLAAQILTSFQL